MNTLNFIKTLTQIQSFRICLKEKILITVFTVIHKLANLSFLSL